jgi:hypothetical protein
VPAIDNFARCIMLWGPSASWSTLAPVLASFPVMRKDSGSSQPSPTMLKRITLTDEGEYVGRGA